MTIIRFETINWLDGSRFIEIEPKPHTMGESVTDKSHFIPTVEAIKRIKNAVPLSSEQIATMYDFADGKDNRQKVPSSRKLGRDLSEISTEIRNNKKEYAKALKEGAENANIAKSVDNALNSVTINSNAE